MIKLTKFNRTFFRFLFVLGITFLFCTPQSNRQVKNVIFFIGDGMGITHITATRIYLEGIDHRFTIENMPVTGLVTTHSVDKLITDSAAGATALATGFKTQNGVIGLSPDSLILYSILEAARDKGLATGLIATSSITHATPAGFAAHVMSRQQEDVIASQLLDAQIPLIMGGGKSFFIPQQDSLSRRKDEKNLITEAVSRGYQFVENKDQLPSDLKLPLLGLFAAEALSHQSTEPSLKEMTEKAIDLLSENKKGFFLMVEGSQIDWAAHENDFPYLIKEMTEFDEAVAAALAFAEKDKHTLIVVTADHETGGLLITGGTKEGKDIKLKWGTTGHTGTPVPLFATGAQAHLFTGLKDNTQLPILISQLLGIKNFPRKIQYSSR